MLDAIRSFFRSSMVPAEAEPDGTDTRPDLRLAACALLLELAYADDEFTADERDHLESAERLLDLAEQERRQAVDLWQFTNLIADQYSLGQKTVLAEIMWGLVYSDGDLAGKEDYLMRKICNLLRIKPGYLAEARKRVEDQQGMRGLD